MKETSSEESQEKSEIQITTANMENKCGGCIHNWAKGNPKTANK